MQHKVTIILISLYKCQQMAAPKNKPPNHLKRSIIIIPYKEITPFVFLGIIKRKKLIILTQNCD